MPGLTLAFWGRPNHIFNEKLKKKKWRTLPDVFSYFSDNFFTTINIRGGPLENDGRDEEKAEKLSGIFYTQKLVIKLFAEISLLILL